MYFCAIVIENKRGGISKWQNVQQKQRQAKNAKILQPENRSSAPHTRNNNLCINNKGL